MTAKRRSNIVSAADPLADLIAEYRRKTAAFCARSGDEPWDALTAETYGPSLDRLIDDPPQPNSPAGVAAAISLAIAEPELMAVVPVLTACLRYLEGAGA